MSARVDHAAKAREHLKGWDTEGDWSAEVAAAQVHATLALVEQQRIANTLALGQYKIAPGDMPIYRGVIFDGESVKADIREALGL